MNKYIITGFLLCLLVSPLWGQIDRRDVRKGNRDFRKENYREADIDYRKALVKDSLSVAANYNLASNLYRQKDMEQAKTTLERIGEVVAEAPQAADYYFNLGDVAIAQQDWQGAVTAFEESLVRNPDDMQAKENYIYARQMLRNQQNQQNQDQQQNQDNQQNNDQNQDNQNNDDQQDQQDQQDGRNDQDNQDGQDKNDGQQDRQPQQNQGQQPKITPQAAQQMLQAIQAKEKETQDKVNKQKAEALKSRQKDKNW